MAVCRVSGRIYVATADRPKPEPAPRPDGLDKSLKMKWVPRFCYTPEARRAGVVLTFPGTGSQYLVGPRGNLVSNKRQGKKAAKRNLKFET